MIFPVRFCIAILACTLLFSCGEKKNFSVSPNSVSTDSIIAQDKMILILADVHVIEGALQVEGNESQQLNDKAGFYYQGIFRKYNISRNRYDQSLKYYSQNPENFAKMYDKVIDLLEIRQKNALLKK